MEDNKPTTEVPNPELRQVERDYKREVALTTGVPMAKKIALVVWTIFDIALIFLFLFVVVGYLVLGQFTDRAEVSSMANNISSVRLFSVENSASSLLIGDTSVIPLGSGKFDFVSTVQNSNEDWYAEFDYYFSSGSQSTEVIHGYVMPLQLTPVVALRQSVDSIAGAEVVIDDLVWHRVDPHTVSDIDIWLKDHNSFTISNAEYTKDIEIDNTDIPRTSFTVTNDSAYNYWSAVFYVVLDRNGSIVGVNQVTVPGFEVGETRQVNVNWFGEIVSSADVSIYPYINYFDEDVYMDQPSAETDIDRRDIIN